MEQAEIIYRVEGQTLWIVLPPELDHHSSRFLKEHTEQILREHYIRRIVFDFSGTTFMDSTGIGVLMGRYKRMRDCGGTVELYGVGERIGRILKMSGLEGMMGKGKLR